MGVRSEFYQIQETCGVKQKEPALVPKASTRLVFAMGATAAAKSTAERAELIDQTVEMLRMIMNGSQVMAKATG